MTDALHDAKIAAAHDGLTDMHELGGVGAKNMHAQQFS